MPNPEKENPNLPPADYNFEKEIGKIEKEAGEKADFREKADKMLEELQEEDQDLQKFLDKTTEGLEPYSKEIIHFFAALFKIAEREMNRENFKDKETLVTAAQNLLDNINQAEEFFQKFFTYKKYQKQQEILEDIKIQAQAILEDAKSIKEKKIALTNPISILSQNIGFQYQNISNLAKDIYHTSLMSGKNSSYYYLPDEIKEYIRKRKDS